MKTRAKARHNAFRKVRTIVLLFAVAFFGLAAAFGYATANIVS